jgi:hypothetical protein
LEQRAAAGAMMSSKIKIPVIKQRIIQDTLDNPAAQMKASFKSVGADCELK